MPLITSQTRGLQAQYRQANFGSLPTGTGGVSATGYGSTMAPGFLGSPQAQAQASPSALPQAQAGPPVTSQASPPATSQARPPSSAPTQTGQQKISSVPMVYYHPQIETQLPVANVHPSSVALIEDYLHSPITSLNLSTIGVRNASRYTEKNNKNNNNSNNKKFRKKHRGSCGCQAPKTNTLKYIPCDKCPCKK